MWFHSAWPVGFEPLTCGGMHRLLRMRNSSACVRGFSTSFFPVHSLHMELTTNRDTDPIQIQTLLMVSTARRYLRSIRHLPDRLLQPIRRRRMSKRLAGRRVQSVLFVCHGNINRSAYAAAVFPAHVTGPERKALVVRSAGFIGPGRPASDHALKIASQRGVDLSGHESRLIDGAEARSTDLIVVMSARQRAYVIRVVRCLPECVVVLGDFDPQPAPERTIQDPYGHTEEVFDAVFDRIDRCVAVMGSLLSDGTTDRVGLAGSVQGEQR